MKRSSQSSRAQLRRHRRDDESDSERLQNRAQCRGPLGVRHGGGKKGRAPTLVQAVAAQSLVTDS